MNKSLSIIIGMVLILISTIACNQVGETPLERGFKLIDNGKYLDAINTFQALIQSDETLYEAWFGIVEAYMKDEKYGDAEDTLEVLLEVIIINYDEAYEAINYPKIVTEFTSYVEDIVEAVGEVGSWYLKLQPESVDLYDFDFGIFSVGDELILPVPENTLVYYTLDGSSVSKTSTLYDGGILLNNIGEYTLTVAIMNKIGVISTESYAYLVVKEGISKPTSNYNSGTYEGPITLKFQGYDIKETELYYTVDGSNPKEGKYYESGTGVTLYAGEYQVQVVAFNLETDQYSKPLILDFVITGISEAVGNNNANMIQGPVILNLAIFLGIEGVAEEVTWVAGEVASDYEDISVAVTTVYSYEDLTGLLESDNPPDVIYTEARLASDIYSYIGDVKSVVVIKDQAFYGATLEATWYWDGHYTLPVTVRPYDIVFYNTDILLGNYDSGIDYQTMMGEINVDSDSLGIIYPKEIGFWELMAYYDGYGGTIINNSGYITLAYQPLVNAFAELQQMASNKIIDPYNDRVSWEEALYMGSSDFMVADPIEMSLDNINENYEPLGALPMSNGASALYPLLVEGLMIRWDICQNPDGDKAYAIGILYDYLANQTVYNSYIANISGALPGKVGIYNDSDYFTDFVKNTYYEAVIMASPALSIDLYELATEYIDFNVYVLAVMEGSLTPEKAAKQLIKEIELVYTKE